MTDSSSHSVAAQLAIATAELTTIADTPRLDAELLLCHALEWPRTALYTRSDAILNSTQIDTFKSLLTQRLAGMPIAYLLKRQEFWSLPISVNDSVLIPRPDTELLVSTTLAIINRAAIDSDVGQANWQDASILELGTGSGAISLALATEQPQLNITACDVSASALTVARENADQLHLSSITFVESDWFEQLSNKRYHLIVSNPPYIPEDDPHLNNTGVKFEPRIALVSGVDGLAAIRHIVHQARQHLISGGRLLVEHGFDQGPSVCKVFEGCGYTEITTLKDAAGHNRVTYGQHNDKQR